MSTNKAIISCQPDYDGKQRRVSSKESLSSISSSPRGNQSALIWISSAKSAVDKTTAKAQLTEQLLFTLLAAAGDENIIQVSSFSSDCTYTLFDLYDFLLSLRWRHSTLQSEVVEM